jgi:serine/threonine protein phosphatase PrpC
MLHEQIIKSGKVITKATEEMLDKLIAPDCDDENGLDNMTLVVVRMKQK